MQAPIRPFPREAHDARSPRLSDPVDRGAYILEPPSIERRIPDHDIAHKRVNPVNSQRKRKELCALYH